MPDRRKHRGPHTEDASLFSEAMLPPLRTAVNDLSWLRTKGYSENASIKLIGDRFQLVSRQRNAVRRCSCSDQSLRIRNESHRSIESLGNKVLRIDGFNVLTTVESALGHALILVGRDGVYRDIASLHGTYRKVEETIPAIEAIASLIKEFRFENIVWHFDQPISNSGRISNLVQEVGETWGLQWETVLEHDPDPTLSATDDVVATADSVILDRCQHWLNLCKLVIDSRISSAWQIDLTSDLD